jgi:hypothetical protein
MTSQSYGFRLFTKGEIHVNWNSGTRPEAVEEA